MTQPLVERFKRSCFVPVLYPSNAKKPIRRSKQQSEMIAAFEEFKLIFSTRID